MAHNSVANADRNAPPITRILAEFVSNHPSKGWDDTVEHEAHRTFLNWLGCAIGAARHPAVSAALAAMQEFEPAGQATIPGRSERLDMGGAALLNGISSHTFDFDDTHLKTLVHPAGPVASAILALAEKTGASGRDIVDSLVLGIDVACRLGAGMYPEHYDRGWHITGSTGVLGAAAGCARLLRLDTERTAMALGIAASQPIGLREQFGTMTKPFHPGAAARAGLTAALMAKHGFTSSPRALEAARGYMQVVSVRQDWNKVTEALGERFEISFNSYKPFACGVVIHPFIDGCAQLRTAGLDPDDIESVELKAHSLVLELTGKTSPTNGLEGKFSVYHGCAAGFVFGVAGEAEFADEIVARADMVALRGKVSATVDDRIGPAAADITVTCKDGRRLHVFVEHAVGSLERPMTDAHLESKFDSLVVPMLGASKASRLKSLCWSLSGLDSMNGLCETARP
ncbi:MAG: 2-methylcitrate dehydratase-like protein [Herminiimonas sp.]|nr:2-methylcitrate dehydratase-like protein [Herminiimonas sp.]